jgi:hypothetical protein
MTIEARLPAAMARRQGGQALDIEAGDQVGDGVAGASAGGAGSPLVVIAGGDGQEDPGSGDFGGGGDLGAADMGQGREFVVGEGTEGILLAARHGSLRGIRGRSSYPGRRVMAMTNENDPLVIPDKSDQITEDVAYRGSSLLATKPEECCYKNEHIIDIFNIMSQVVH